MIFSILILFSGAKKVKEMVKSGGRARGLVKLGLPNHSGSSRFLAIFLDEGVDLCSRISSQT